MLNLCGSQQLTKGFYTEFDAWEIDFWMTLIHLIPKTGLNASG